MVPAALAAFCETAAQVGNASSLHGSGRQARAIVESAREQIAAALDAHPTEIVFTSGGTEADNLALAGSYASRTGVDPLACGVVTSAFEHHAVLEAAESLEARGAVVRLVQPEPDGVVAVDAIAAALDELSEAGSPAAVASLMWANNELGTIQPIAEFAEAARDRGVTAHSDAVQAAGPLPISFADSGLDLMTVSAHKLGGPMGIGVLCAARSACVAPIVHGGGHERGLRSGTVPVALVSAAAAAFAAADEARPARTPHLVELRDRLISGVLALGLDITVGGRWTAGSGEDRLPGNAHFIVPGCEADSLLFLMDAAGIEASTGSACQAGVPGRSHVLTALGVDDPSVGVLRLTLGHTSTDEDVDAAIAAIATCVPRARAAAGALR